MALISESLGNLWSYFKQVNTATLNGKFEFDLFLGDASWDSTTCDLKLTSVRWFFWGWFFDSSLSEGVYLDMEAIKSVIKSARAWASDKFNVDMVDKIQKWPLKIKKIVTFYKLTSAINKIEIVLIVHMLVSTKQETLSF